MVMYWPGVWFSVTLLALIHQPIQAEWVAIDQQYQSSGLQTVYMGLLAGWLIEHGDQPPERIRQPKMPTVEQD